MFTEVAKSAPFEGAPEINTPSIIGAKTGRTMNYRLPITGERPIYVTVIGLPDGLNLKNEPYMICGRLGEGVYDVVITAENRLGKAVKALTVEVGDNAVPRSPLLGWTSWNAYQNIIDQDKIYMNAKVIAESGLADYGYAYVNIDSGWQGEYGGKYGGIMANEYFPDMHKLVSDIHALGLKAGIYSSPMMLNYGSTPMLQRKYIGTTSGEVDDAIPGYTQAGKVHHEREAARQFGDYGFDYLKYDWSPARMYHLRPMADALLTETEREFALSVTCLADKTEAEKLMSVGSSVRNNIDSYPRWDVVTQMIESSDGWLEYVKPGHFFDCDMLATGEIQAVHGRDIDEITFRVTRNADGRLIYSPDEVVFEYTMRAILPSPIQLSCDLSKMTAFEFDVYTNSEVLAINQDSLCAPAVLEECRKDGDSYVRVYRKPLENGDSAVAIFNIGETDETVSVKVSGRVRDVWAKRDADFTGGEYKITLPPRTVKLIRTGK